MSETRTAIFVFAAVLVACGEATPAASSPSSSSPNAPSAATPGAATPSTAWPFDPAFSNEDRAAQLDRLAKDAGPIKTNWVPPGRGDRYGHAEGLVAAPFETVRAKLLDFMHYKDLAGPKFETVKVVAKEGATTDVYFNLPIMKGLVKIWYVTRFAGAREASGGQVVEGTFVKGNIKDMHIAFTLRNGPDDRSVVLVCDLDLALSIPAPQSAVDEELRDACGDAINSVRRTLAPPPPAP